MASMEKWSVLTICGGAGGEGIFFLNNGFSDVTVSDFSENAIEIAREIDPRLKTLWANAEAIGCEDASYDLVVVQDGLHHLPRPVLGFTEMLRVSRVAVIVIEPHLSIVGSVIGTEWENLNGAINYVFRWNKKLAVQVVKSMLLHNFKEVKVLRFWDHGLVISKISAKFPARAQLALAKSIYRVLSLIDFAGNMFVCVVRK
jgi:ubiquinone/menaquinone biosynthesis C-methylase UbiE